MCWKTYLFQQRKRLEACKRDLTAAKLLLDGQRPPHVPHWATQGGGIGLDSIAVSMLVVNFDFDKYRISDEQGCLFWITISPSEQ